MIQKNPLQLLFVKLGIFRWINAAINKFHWVSMSLVDFPIIRRVSMYLGIVPWIYFRIRKNPKDPENPKESQDPGSAFSP